MPKPKQQEQAEYFGWWHCPSCGKTNSSEFTVCQKCGRPMPASTSYRQVK